MFAIAIAVCLSPPPVKEYIAALKAFDERVSRAEYLSRRVGELTVHERRLLELLDSSHPHIRLIAVRGLKAIPNLRTTDEIGERIARLLRGEPEPAVRAAAIRVFGETRSETILESVAQALCDTDRDVRDAAAFWFDEHPLRPDLAVPSLAKFLTQAHREPASREVLHSITCGLSALRSFGRAAHEAIPTVLLLTDHTNPDLRRSAMLTLAFIARDREAMAKEFRKRFLNADRKLYDPDRVAALRAAVHLGPAAAEFVPEYLRYLQADLLGEPAPPAGVANPTRDMLHALRKLGPAAKSAGPELVKLVARADEKYPHRGEMAVTALMVGVSDDADLKVLVKVFAAKDGQEWVNRELSYGDRFPQFRRHADKLCKLIAAEWDTDPVDREVYSRGKTFAGAIGADGAGLLPFLDKIAGVAGPPVGDDPRSQILRREYLDREGQAAWGAKLIREAIAKRKAVLPKK